MAEEAIAAQDDTEAAEGVTANDLYPEGEEKPEGEEASKGEDKPVEEPEGDDKPEEEEEGEVPEKYDLKPAEDTLLEDDDLERIASTAKELGLTNEEAQDLLNLESDAVGRYHDKLMKEMDSARENWVKDAEKDKEIGGEAFKENVENAKRVIEKFGSEGFKKFLDDTAFGNHPEVIRVFSRIGKLMSEDKLILGEQRKGDKPIEEVFYPTKDE